jgi:hypothetical protein
VKRERRAQELLSKFKNDPSFENWSFRDFIQARNNLNWAILKEYLSSCYIRASIIYLERISPVQKSELPEPTTRPKVSPAH